MRISLPFTETAESSTVADKVGTNRAEVFWKMTKLEKETKAKNNPRTFNSHLNHPPPVGVCIMRFLALHMYYFTINAMKILWSWSQNLSDAINILWFPSEITWTAIDWVIDAEPGFVGGRWIWKEGTFATTESGAPIK